ncbi:MAG: signal peptidase II [Candidatus Moranbacteria bacterium]|nr:signal peptidase II [Candidatus Moranbacteria bacterium]
MNLVCNAESAWGLINNKGIILSGGILLLLVILYLGYNAESRRAKIGWLLVFLGGAGNVFERFRFGCVRDYWRPLSWYPAFNMQDVLIGIGFFILFVAYLEKLKVKELRRKG